MSTLPDIEFLKRLGRRIVEETDTEALPTISIDVPLGTASDFYKAVLSKGGTSKEWKELIAMAKDRCEHNRNSYWYLDELNNMVEYFGRTATASVVKVVQDYIDEAVSSVDWKELARFASIIKSQKEYVAICKKLGIEGRDKKSVVMRKALADLVRDNGVAIDEGDPVTPDMDRIKAETVRYYSVVDRTAFKTRRETRRDGIAIEEIARGRRIAKELFKIPDSTGWCRRLAEKYIDGEIEEDALKERLKACVGEETYREAEEAIGPDIIQRIEDYNTKDYRVLREDLDYGEDILVSAGTTGRVLEESQDMVTVLFNEYGVVATLPTDMFEPRTEAVAYLAHTYEGMDKESRAMVARGECPLCSTQLIDIKRVGSECVICGEVVGKGKVSYNTFTMPKISHTMLKGLRLGTVGLIGTEGVDFSVVVIDNGEIVTDTLMSLSELEDWFRVNGARLKKYYVVGQ